MACGHIFEVERRRRQHCAHCNTLDQRFCQHCISAYQPDRRLLCFECIVRAAEAGMRRTLLVVAG
eukprot:4866540-Alexandrium_andersonii.AAC.1